MLMEAWAKPADTSFSKHEPTVTTLPGEGAPFDPEKIPPDWTAAQLHAVRYRQKAQRVLQLKAKFAEAGEALEDYCPCCHHPHSGLQFPLLCDVKDLAELGEGFPLYFDLVKWVGFALLLAYLVAGCFCTYRNYSEANIAAEELRSNWIVRGSLANYGDSSSPSIAEPSLHLSALFLLLLLHEFLIIRHEKMQADLDQNIVTPSDYTIVVRNLPKEGLDTVALWRFLEQESRLVSSN